MSQELKLNSIPAALDEVPQLNLAFNPALDIRRPPPQPRNMPPTRSPSPHAQFPNANDLRHEVPPPIHNKDFIYAKNLDIPNHRHTLPT